MAITVHKIGFVDPYKAVRTGIIEVLKKENFQIVIEANNGEDFIEKIKNIKQDDIPSLILMEIDMPLMDGFQTMDWIKENFPELKVIVFTSSETYTNVVSMISRGVSSFVSKSDDISTLINAINFTITNGTYFTQKVSEFLAEAVRTPSNEINFTKRELEFFQLISSELSYADIAEKMQVTFKTVEGFRDRISRKANVSTRIGLVLYAIKNNLVTLQNY